MSGPFLLGLAAGIGLGGLAMLVVFSRADYQRRARIRHLTGELDAAVRDNRHLVEANVDLRDRETLARRVLAATVRERDEARQRAGHLARQVEGLQEARGFAPVSPLRSAGGAS